MKIFVPPLEIGDNEGFSDDKDLFGRKDFGDGLTRLITNVDDPLVIALDGQWGSGKTTFLKMWAGELRKQGFPVVFFDAFAHDYMSDAFMALAGQIVALAEEKEKSQRPQTKEFVDKATRVGKILLRSSLKIGIKAATLGALSGDDVEGVAKDVAKEASDLEDKYFGELLTKQAQEKDAIEEFKSALETLSSSLADETSTAENDTKPLKKPLVFIIDELDRCRPDFALSLLERIKHFFSVQGVFFVLGVNYPQLENSVRACYGVDIDAHNYLQKFIHFNFPIDSDQTVRGRSVENNRAFVSKLFSDHGFPNKDFTAYLAELFATLLEGDLLSLRDIERIASNIALVIGFGDWNVFDQEVAVCLIILRTKNRDLYQKAKKGNLTYQELDDNLLKYSSDMPNSGGVFKLRFIELWKYLLTGSDNQDYKFSQKIPSQDILNFVNKCAKLYVERTGRI